MKKNGITKLIFCLLLSIVVVVILLALSKDKTGPQQDFARLLQQDAITKMNDLDIKYSSYYIAGGTNNYIYLGNYTSPIHLILSNTTLTDTQHVKINIKNLETLKLRTTSTVKVDSPYFYVIDGNGSNILQGRILQGRMKNWYPNRLMSDSIRFAKAVPITSSSFATVLYNENQEFVLGKLYKEQGIVKLGSDILEKQIDGIFCTDGMLHYNKEISKLIYMYYYRNQYIVVDTNLNLIYRGKTIDSISQAQIQIDSITSKYSKSMTVPPLTVNKCSSTFKEWLLVNSNILSRNELKEVLSQASVIDVYNLTNNTYRFSFYLYNHDGSQMRDFQVLGNKLLAIYDHYLLSYDLNENYF